MKWFERTLVWLCLGVFLVGVVMLAWADPASAATYTLEDTSPFFGSGINTQGHMAGQWCDGVTGCFPAIWRGPGDVKVLSEFTGVALSLNNHDEAVYIGLDANANDGAWFWSAQTGSVPLTPGDHPYERALPLRLNDARQIVGVLENFHTPGGCPVRWASPTAAPECLIPFASDSGQSGLNQAGTSTGFWQGDSNAQHGAFRHHALTGLQPIPFGPTVAINDRNVVLYEGSATLLADGTLLPPVAVPDCVNTQGIDLNNAGWIVGHSDCPAGPRGWVQDARQRLIDLTTVVNDPAWTLEFPFGISQLGEIVLWGMRDGELRGVRLTPRLVAVVRSRR